MPEPNLTQKQELSLKPTQEPTQEQKMNAEIQQSLGKAIFWIYVLAGNGLVVCFAFFFTEGKPHGWVWLVLVAAVSGTLTWEWLRHRRAPRVVEPYPVKRSRGWLYWQTGFMVIYLASLIFADFRWYKLLFFAIVPLVFWVRSKLDKAVGRGLAAQRGEELPDA